MKLRKMNISFASLPESSPLPGAAPACGRAGIGPQPGRKTTAWSGDQRGFTLMEVMVSAIVLAMTAAGLFSLLFQAYKLSALARYRDDARAVLQTFASQFQAMQATGG
ncbi:MAG: prepilin-type N-terminal cleavage/methylation domain-containing protein, partial [Opitutaceae bacterium]